MKIPNMIRKEDIKWYLDEQYLKLKGWVERDMFKELSNTLKEKFDAEYMSMKGFKFPSDPHKKETYDQLVELLGEESEHPEKAREREREKRRKEFDEKERKEREKEKKQIESIFQDKHAIIDKEKGPMRTDEVRFDVPTIIGYGTTKYELKGLRTPSIFGTKKWQRKWTIRVYDPELHKDAFKVVDKNNGETEKINTRGGYTADHLYAHFNGERHDLHPVFNKKIIFKNKWQLKKFVKETNMNKIDVALEDLF